MTELLSIAKPHRPVRHLRPADRRDRHRQGSARARHPPRLGPRAAKPFVPFNCTAVPREMLESQLFGYRKGAFTGAEQSRSTASSAPPPAARSSSTRSRRSGLDLQPKLLRFLETHEVHGLGEAQPVKVDVRVIAATNADLETLVADGRFREDLFYRLNVVRLRLPPLRERREEIPPLIDHYLREVRRRTEKGTARRWTTRRWSTSCSTPGPATCGSWSTRSAASSPSPIPTARSRRRCCRRRSRRRAAPCACCPATSRRSASASTSRSTTPSKRSSG